MSKQAFETFKAKLSEDSALRQEMARTLSQGGSKTTASADEVIAFAKSRGYDFNADDVRQNVELSDAELDAVAGGAAGDYFLTFHGIAAEGQKWESKEIEIHSFSWGIR